MQEREKERESEKEDENMIYDMTSPLPLFVNIDISYIVIRTIIIHVVIFYYKEYLNNLKNNN